MRFDKCLCTLAFAASLSFSSLACNQTPDKDSTEEAAPRVYGVRASLISTKTFGVTRWHAIPQLATHAIVFDGADAKGRTRFTLSIQSDPAKNTLTVTSWGGIGARGVAVFDQTTGAILSSDQWSIEVGAVVGFMAADWSARSRVRAYSDLGDAFITVGTILERASTFIPGAYGKVAKVAGKGAQLVGTFLNAQDPVETKETPPASAEPEKPAATVTSQNFDESTGIQTTTYSDGSVTTVDTKNGTAVTTWGDGNAVSLTKEGEEASSVNQADGTTLMTYKDASGALTTLTVQKDGSTIQVNADGTKVTTQLDGSQTTVSPDGTTSTSNTTSPESGGATNTELPPSDTGGNVDDSAPAADDTSSGSAESDPGSGATADDTSTDDGAGASGDTTDEGAFAAGICRVSGLSKQTRVRICLHY
jgi:hypothetical protein